MDARSAQATPRLKVAVAATAVDAHECAVLAISAIAALGLAPQKAGRMCEQKWRQKNPKPVVPSVEGIGGGGAGVDSGRGCSPVANPARIAARALASDVIAGVPVATWRAAVATALAVEASGARLVALGAVPAGLAGQAAALSHRAWLLALALAASGEGAGG